MHGIVVDLRSLHENWLLFLSASTIREKNRWCSEHHTDFTKQTGLLVNVSLYSIFPVRDTGEKADFLFHYTTNVSCVTLVWDKCDRCSCCWTWRDGTCLVLILWAVNWYLSNLSPCAIVNLNAKNGRCRWLDGFVQYGKTMFRISL